jgi:hypothetical protein
MMDELLEEYTFIRLGIAGNAITSTIVGRISNLIRSNILERRKCWHNNFFGKKTKNNNC